MMMMMMKLIFKKINLQHLFKMIIIEFEFLEKY